MTVHGYNSLRTFGHLSYGDATGPLGALAVYEFPPTYSISSSTKPVIGENGISAKYNRNELTITWVLPYAYVSARTNPNSTPDGDASPASIDTAVQQIRSILMQPRKTLRCEYQGLGPKGNAAFYGITIDSSNDLNFGPQPIDFKWKNLAAQQAVEMTWVVVFHTHNQIIFNSANSVVKTPTIFTEFSWSRSYDIDEIGCATITTTGKFSIAPYLNAHVDQLRKLAAFPVPLYCQRISQKFQHDPTSKSTTFTIIDKEHRTENALPPGCLKMDLTHEVNSAIFGGRLEGKGFYRWNNIIQGSITLPPGERFSTAYILFWFYARQRLWRTESGGIADPAVAITSEKINKETNKIKENTVKSGNILTRISYKESLFDRTHNFRIEYVGTYSRDKLIQQSGLFTPLYNYRLDSSLNYKYWWEFDKSDYEPWHLSFARPTAPVNPNDDPALAKQWSDYLNYNGFPNNRPDIRQPGSAWSVYGYTGMNEDAGPWIFIPDDQNTDNVKVNLAGHGINLPAWVYPGDSRGNNEEAATSQPKIDAYSSGVNPSQSYLHYDNSFSIIEDVNTFQVVRQAYDTKIDNSMKSFLGSNAPGKSHYVLTLHNSLESNPVPPSSDYTTSYNSQPVTTILMSGSALRAGYPPTIPIAFQYKGSSLVRSGQSIVTIKQLAQGAVPVYLATWSIPYYANTSVHSNFFKDLESTAFAGDLT